MLEKIKNIFRKRNQIKLAFLLLCLQYLSIVGYSQSERQIGLMSDFLSRKGVRLIGDWSHPTCSVTSYTSSIIDHNYFININFATGSQTFTCYYRLTLDKSGKPLTFSANSCECPTIFKCFDACDFWKTIFKELTENEKEIIPRLLNKGLSAINCVDACFGRLYYSWSEGGYYRQY